MSLLKVMSAVRELHSLDRKRAEMLYVLATLNARQGYFLVAKGYAEECLLLLSQIGSNSYEECATNLVCVEGVCLPEFLHEGVVCDYFASFLTLEKGKEN